MLFLVSSIRYYPGDPAATLVDTARHLLATVPLVLGFTLLVLSLLHRLAGIAFNLSNGLRFFLLAGLFVEFLYGIYHYLTVSGGLPPS